MSLPFENSHIFATRGEYPNTSTSTEWRPSSKNIKVHFRVWNGSSPVTHTPLQILIFNHGFLGNSTNFRKLYTPLQQRPNIFAMIALDCPGFGYSDRGTHIFHHDRERAYVLWETVLYAIQNCLHASIDSTTQIEFTIIAHSMGARTSAAMVRYAPVFGSNVKNVILIGGAASNHFMNNVLGKSNVGMKFGKLFAHLPGAKTLIRWTGKLVATKSTVRKILLKEYKTEPTEEEINLYLAPLLLQGTFEGLIDMFALISSGEEFVEEEVEKMTQFNHTLNVLLICGTKDEVVSPKISEALQMELEKVKGSSTQKIEICKIDDAGHLPMESKPEIVLSAIYNFCDEQKK